MEKEKIEYSELNPKQKELYNLSQLSKILADYGYLCTKLSADWSNADFIAQHYKSGKIYKVQLKSRLFISKHYEKKDIYIAFPHNGKWFIVLHDELIKIVEKNTNYLQSKSWLDGGKYSSDNPSQKLLEKLANYEWKVIDNPCVSGQRKK